MWAGVIGPAGFISAWVVAGARSKGYSPSEDAISLLAAADASTRWLMTAGFVCFGIAVPVFALVVRRALPGWAWLAVAVSGFATLAVAAFPLHVSSTVSALHGVFASIGYIALALTPVLAAPVLQRRGHRGAAAASRAVAVLSGVCLVATSFANANGLFQRAGLTVVDVWLMAAAVAIATTNLRRETPHTVVGQRKNDGRSGR